MIDTLTQGHLLPVVAPAAILTGIGGVDFHKRAPSFCRFGCKLVEKPCPCRIRDAFSKTMMVSHPVDMQVFHADHPKTIDYLAALLVGEVVTSEGNTLVHTGHSLAVLPSLRGAFREFGMFALHLCQRLLLFAEKPGILDCFSSGESRKGFQSNVYPYLSISWRQAFRFALNQERDVPFACRTPMHRTRFHLPLERPVIDHLDRPNFGEDHPILMGDAKATLGEGERVIAPSALETGIACFLSRLPHSAKECLKGQIDPYRDILQYLGMDIFQGGTFLFQCHFEYLGMENFKGGTFLFNVRSFPVADRARGFLRAARRHACVFQASGYTANGTLQGSR